MLADIFFTYYVGLFCSDIVVDIIEFYTTVMQVRGLHSYKTRFHPPLSTQENACTKSVI